jgi:membrane fusion protein, multidrug efflux system
MRFLDLTRPDKPAKLLTGQSLSGSLALFNNMKNPPFIASTQRRVGACAARSLVLALTSALTFALAACSKPAEAPQPVRAVKVMTVGASSLIADTEYAGEVRARVESRLGFRVAGKITQRQAEVGQRVKAGQVLAQMDPQDYQLAVAAARAQVSAALTNRDQAAADFKRFSTLKDQNFISGADLERRDATLKAAQAQLDQAQAQLANVGNQAAYTRLVAPMNGVVTAVEAEAGQVVTAGAPVVRVAQEGPRDVVINVPEDRRSTLPAGTEVKIKPWGDSEVLTARVREVAAAADPATRTYAIKLGLDANAGLPLGSTVAVVPPSLVAGVQAIKLPTSAVFESKQTSHVWLLDKASMTVKAQPVQVAGADGNEVVIAGGLKDGDTIVATGTHVLAPGQKVRLYQAPAAVKP